MQNTTQLCFEHIFLAEAQWVCFTWRVWNIVCKSTIRKYFNQAKRQGYDWYL